MSAPRILIAGDEPLLREALALLWPEAQIVAEAADGIEALRLGRALAPDIAILDIRMPGLDGLALAQVFGAATRIVFVTAYQEHAVAAFEQGAIDYVVKPIGMERLARVRERLASPPPDLGPLMRKLQAKTAPSWLQASVGSAIHFIDLADVVYFCADAKYTRVVTDTMEVHIRLSLKELGEALDGAAFW